MITHLVYEKNLRPGLYDALMNNWKGYEDLHRYYV